MATTPGVPSRSVRSLAAQMRAKADDVRLRQGVIDAVHPGPPVTVDVLVSGSTSVIPGVVSVGAHAAAGAAVWLLHVGSTMLALGSPADATLSDLAGTVTPVAFARSGLGQTSSIASGGGWSRPFVPDVDYNEDVTLQSYDGAFRAVVVAVAGLVAFSCAATIDSNGQSGRREISIARYNSAEVLQDRHAVIGSVAPSGGSEISLSTHWPVLVAAGDKVSLEVRQFSGGTAANLSASSFVSAINRNDS